MILQSFVNHWWWPPSLGLRVQRPKENREKWRKQSGYVSSEWRRKFHHVRSHPKKAQIRKWNTSLQLSNATPYLIFYWSWSSHGFPSCWKPATIVPIRKLQTSLLSPNLLCFHLEFGNLVSPAQAGFHGVISLSDRNDISFTKIGQELSEIWLSQVINQKWKYVHCVQLLQIPNKMLLWKNFNRCRHNAVFPSCSTLEQQSSRIFQVLDN